MSYDSSDMIGNPFLAKPMSGSSEPQNTRRQPTIMPRLNPSLPNIPTIGNTRNNSNKGFGKKGGKNLKGSSSNMKGQKVSLNSTTNSNPNSININNVNNNMNNFGSNINNDQYNIFNTNSNLESLDKDFNDVMGSTADLDTESDFSNPFGSDLNHNDILMSNNNIQSTSQRKAPSIPLRKLTTNMNSGNGALIGEGQQDSWSNRLSDGPSNPYAFFSNNNDHVNDIQQQQQQDLESDLNDYDQDDDDDLANQNFDTDDDFDDIFTGTGEFDDMIKEIEANSTNIEGLNPIKIQGVKLKNSFQSTGDDQNNLQMGDVICAPPGTASAVTQQAVQKLMNPWGLNGKTEYYKGGGKFKGKGKFSSFKGGSKWQNNNNPNMTELGKYQSFNSTRERSPYRNDDGDKTPTALIPPDRMRNNQSNSKDNNFQQVPGQGQARCELHGKVRLMSCLEVAYDMVNKRPLPGRFICREGKECKGGGMDKEAKIRSELIMDNNSDLTCIEIDKVLLNQPKVKMDDDNISNSSVSSDPVEIYKCLIHGKERRLQYLEFDDDIQGHRCRQGFECKGSLRISKPIKANSLLANQNNPNQLNKIEKKSIKEILQQKAEEGATKQIQSTLNLTRIGGGSAASEFNSVNPYGGIVNPVVEDDLNDIGQSSDPNSSTNMSNNQKQIDTTTANPNFSLFNQGMDTIADRLKQDPLNMGIEFKISMETGYGRGRGATNNLPLVRNVAGQAPISQRAMCSKHKKMRLRKCLIMKEDGSLVCEPANKCQ